MIPGALCIMEEHDRTRRGDPPHSRKAFETTATVNEIQRDAPLQGNRDGNVFRVIFGDLPTTPLRGVQMRNPLGVVFDRCDICPGSEQDVGVDSRPPFISVPWLQAVNGLKEFGNIGEMIFPGVAAWAGAVAEFERSVEYLRHRFFLPIVKHGGSPPTLPHAPGR